MKVIIPNTPAIISTSEAENEAPAWSSDTTYAKDKKAVYEHAVYQSLADGNSGNQPDKTCFGTDAKWKKIGPTNAYAMVDDKISTQTVSSEDMLTVTLKFNRSTAFALLNVEATLLSVSVKAAQEETPYYTKTYDMLKDRRSRWLYRYEKAQRIKDVVDVGIGIVPSGTITFSLSAPNGRPAVGHVAIGRAFDVGTTLYNATPSIRSFSRVVEDEYGGARFIPRLSAKKLRCDLYLHLSELDRVYEVLRSLINTPALWIGDNRTTAQGGVECLTVWGYLQDVEAPIKGPDHVSIPITINGLV
uniref:hypothetical protein n=1 Tax=uncultured Bilophila sp. TaxID=529385 RepID=UPI0025F01EAF|nr:hypothetical protein [uncultured Bilophila sp.]